MNLTQLLQSFERILRYFAAPAVGIAVACMFDHTGYLLYHLSHLAADSKNGQTVAEASWWPLFFFIVVSGFVIYYVHRNTFHFLSNWTIESWLVRRSVKKGTLNDKPRVGELQFARLIRRGACEHCEQRSVQAGLDQANAAAHFLYCSAWSVLGIPPILASKIAQFTISGREYLAYVMVAAFFLTLAVILDWRATRWDIDAYEQFNQDARRAGRYTR